MVKEENGKNLILKMRGLPWSATVDDIIQFLDDANIKDGKQGVHITMSPEGRPSGEAFVEMETTNDVEKALQRNKQHMGHRYIEIFKTSRSDMESFMAKSSSYVQNVMDECCVRLRGLPYGCTKNDILQFFSGLTIVPNGISFVNDHTGRNSGEAYVQFVNNDMVEKALKKHLDKIGHRYIEIFRSSVAEMSSQTGPKIRSLMSEFVPRPVPYGRGDRYGGQNRFNRGASAVSAPPPSRFRAADYAEDDDSDYFVGGNESLPWGRGMGKNPRDTSISSTTMNNRLSPPPAARVRKMMYGNGNGKGNAGMDVWNDEEQRFIVHMRGLPYRATKQDIANFFKPVVPIDIQIIYDRDYRPSGEATAEFESYEDASFAMSKDKQNINNRYIELFLKSTPQQTDKPASLSGYADDSAPEPLLFSRRTSSSGHVPVSNSAYDGFYGTSMYKAAANAGGGRGQRY